ncbi:MAG: NAD(P)H-binding protein [Stellaceae bacterium]
MTATDTETALIIGATGGIGGETAKALIAAGWRVRALTRDVARARRDFAGLGPVEWLAGDALRAADVVAAAHGAQLLLHAANPPGYRNWRGLALPMLESSIAAARASGARLVLPANIYNFGRDAGAVLDERSPQHPATRKGRIRVEMEERLARAARDGVRSLVVRAGDFFGGYGPSSWFSTAMVRPGKKVRFVIYPGRHDIGHAFAYLPDLAQAIVRLAAIEARLAPVEAVHFAGHWLPRGVEIAEAIRRAAGNPRAPILPFPAALLYLAAPFNETFAEMIEMRYLWQEPLRLDNRKLEALIGPEPRTPLDTAVRRSLAALGCLPDAAAGACPAALGA